MGKKKKDKTRNLCELPVPLVDFAALEAFVKKATKELNEEVTSDNPVVRQDDPMYTLSLNLGDMNTKILDLSNLSLEDLAIFVKYVKTIVNYNVDLAMYNK